MPWWEILGRWGMLCLKGSEDLWEPSPPTVLKHWKLRLCEDILGSGISALDERWSHVSRGRVQRQGVVMFLLSSLREGNAAHVCMAPTHSGLKDNIENRAGYRTKEKSQFLFSFPLTNQHAHNQLPVPRLLYIHFGTSWYLSMVPRCLLLKCLSLK